MKAFKDCWRLKSITIPASVKMIGYAAFRGTGLESINFEDNSLLGEIGIMVSTFNQKYCSLSKFYLYSDFTNYEQCVFVL